MSHAERLRGTPDIRKLPPKHTLRNAAIVLTSTALISAGVATYNLFSNNERSSFLENNTDAFDGGNKTPSAENPGAIIVPTESPSPRPTPKATESPTPTPTAKPTPEATPTTTATPEALSPIEQKMQLAPDIEGAEKKIQTINGLERVTYVAIEDNSYGIEVGKYMGEYKKEVTFEGKETGGIALIPKVAEKILKDQLSKLPEGDQWLIPLPLDISDMKTEGEVELYFGDSIVAGLKDVFWSLKSPEPIDVVDVIPGTTTIKTGTLAADQNVTLINTKFNQDTITPETKKMVVGKEMSYLKYSTPFKGTPICWGKDTFSFGESFGKSSGVCNISLGLMWPEKPTYDKIFKVSNLPAFVTSK